MLFLAVVGIVLAFEATQISAQYNYAQALQKSLLFYEAQRSGRLPANNRIPWRGDSALGDKGTNNEDLAGGYYDAGDFVKFGFPAGQTMVTLAWGALEFKTSYVSSGEWNNMLAALKWGFDYMLKSHSSTNNFWGQCGNGALDHAYWGRPEQMTMARPCYKCTTSAPCSDLAAEAAAALAAGYMIYRDNGGSGDTTYANTLLDNARRLYTFAYNNRALYHNSIKDAEEYYKSSSFNDELAWGAAWLWRATGETQYRTYALQFATTSGTAWAYDWSDKTVGYQLILRIMGETAYQAPVERFLRSYFPGGSVPYTPKGLAWLSQWGSLRYSANAAFIAAVAAKYTILRIDSINFLRSQVNYMLGSTGRSFVCGFGVNPPVRPHHASSSCKDMPAPCSWTDYSSTAPNPQTLNGALVGGPDRNDNYQDVRSDYIANEVTLDYNAGFTGAVVGVLYYNYCGTPPVC